MGLIYTDSGKCRLCYACVRHCPVKAIRIKEGQAQVVSERCIACSTCFRVCAQGAKQYERSIEAVRNMLAGGSPVIALLDPSFPAAFPDVAPGQVVSALQELGFAEVMESAFGAELVAREYRRLLERRKGETIIVSQCPAVVSYIEKYQPHLIDNLAPIVSPPVAMGRLIKQRYNPAAKVVFIGPCLARKNEVTDSKVAGALDAALVFAELREMLAAKGIDPSRQPLGQFSGPRPRVATALPIYGTILDLISPPADFPPSSLINRQGQDCAMQVFRDLSQGNISAGLIDVYFCHCADSPFMRSELSLFQRNKLIAEYAESRAKPEQAGDELEEYADLNLKRTFTPQPVGGPQPTERELEEILARIGRSKPEDRLNCGACGYDTCREMATAVYQGLAEEEMCWPYLLQRCEESQQELIQAEKLTSLGQMAAAIAHELNNPMAGVLVYIKLLLKKVTENTAKREDFLNLLPKMESEITRCSRIIRNLLDFARQTEPMLREVNVNEVVEKALSLVAHQAQLQHIEVQKELDPSLPLITADFDQLQQACTNLILNAVQAMPQGGRLTLRTTLANGRIRIDVQDTGCGIPKENLLKLFTPFFTTKEKGKGVGLGLAVVHGIVERHRGKIEVQSEVGKGTTFTIYLEAPGEGEGQNPGR